MIQVRKARQEDKESIGRIFVHAVQELCATHYTEKEIHVWSGARPPESYEQEIQEGEVFVAEDEQGIVGFGQLDIGKGEIQSVYVSPRYVGRGIGSTILEKLEEVAVENGIHSVHLYSSLNAVGFYERAGYEVKGELQHRMIEEVELSCIYMEKTIQKLID